MLKTGHPTGAGNSEQEVECAWKITRQIHAGGPGGERGWGTNGV